MSTLRLQNQDSALWIAGAAFLLIAAMLVARAVISGPEVFAQTAPWPTPPPGPPFAPPPAELQNATVQVAVDRAESEVHFLTPSWPGHLPLIPPIPQSTFAFTKTGGPPVTLVVDAGAVSQPVQIRLTPLNPNDLPVGWQGTRPLWAVQLESFDPKGKPVAVRAVRPMRMTVRVGGIPESSAGRGLMLASLGQTPARPGEGQQWQPLVTEFDFRQQLLVARLLEFHTIGLFDR